MRNPTDEQVQAINARGKILVSASAGAGKTTVMISRLADVLLKKSADGERVSLDDVLAVTFTKKAAAQMKEKLRDELIKRLKDADGEEKEHIRVQLGKISTADISTIHSFCARLVRTYFYAFGSGEKSSDGDDERKSADSLGVDASFEVLTDGADGAELKNRAMDELFDGLYESEDKDFLYLLARLRRKRSDSSLRNLLLDSYAKVRIRPRYKELLIRTASGTFTEQKFEEICAECGAYFAEKCLAEVKSIEDFSAGFTPVSNGDKYRKVLSEMRETLLCAAEEKNIFAAPNKLAHSSKPGVKPENADEDERYCLFVDGVKKRYKALLKDLKEKEEERRLFTESGELCRAFVSVLLKFDGIYAAVKAEEGKLDYGDLEHYALRLLTGEDCDPAVREQINGKYKYVFVDEYQDVNPIQDEILSAVAQGDVFTVGDVKQAIYGFRGSQSLFFEKKRAELGTDGKYIVLPDNFRSAPAVINFVNDVFSGVMNAPLCDFNYADGHRMKGGSRYPDGYRGDAEIVFYDDDKEKKEEAQGVYTVDLPTDGKEDLTPEGKAVLRLVKQALSSYYYDPDRDERDNPVKVECGDICILTRKRADAGAQGIVRALLSEGYAVSGATEANVCDRPEIVGLLNVLSYIDNRSQDVPLASALLSPLGGLNEEELARIRIYGGKYVDEPLFRRCVQKYVDGKDDALAEKLKKFFAETENLRALSDGVGAARIIDEIMRRGGFVSVFSSEEKIAAVRRLQKEAYGPNGELTLNAFLARLKAEDYNVPAPSSLSSDCIKVMTMHASKGLEFPVVIVADVASSFGGDDKDEMLFDDVYGFAPKYYEESTRSCRSTLLRRLIKSRAAREELRNEVNLFYVACTRAKYSLKVLCGDSVKEGGDLPQYCYARAFGATRYADLINFPSLKSAVRTLTYEDSEEKGDGEINKVLSDQGGKIIDESRMDGELYEELALAFAEKYAYEAGVGLPVKSSASGLLRMRDDTEDAHPLFIEEEYSPSQTGAERGTAYHRFLELCDFSLKEEDEIVSQLEKWKAEGLMTEAQEELLDVGSLCEILKLPVFSSLGGKKIYREREFLCKLPSYEFTALESGSAEDLSVGEDDGNGVIVQGAIDLLAVVTENGKAVGAEIIDYKYTVKDDEALVKKYSPQLALYRSVVCKIYGLPPQSVKSSIINIFARRQIKLQ